MSRPFFLLLLCVSSAYGIMFARCCNLPTWGGQHRHLHSALGIVAYFCVNYKFFDRRYGRRGNKKRRNGRHEDLTVHHNLSLFRESSMGRHKTYPYIGWIPCRGNPRGCPMWVDFRGSMFGCRVWKLDLHKHLYIPRSESPDPTLNDPRSACTLHLRVLALSETLFVNLGGYSRDPEQKYQ